MTASVNFTPNSDWRFTVRGGQERTDIASVQRQRYDNWGAGVNWTPGPRTTLSVDVDRRFFGDAYNVSFQQRQRRAVWSYSASRNVTDGVGSTGAGGVRAYDLFFQLFASQEPDPALRDLLVRSFLDSNGIPAGTLIGGGFLNSAAAVQRRQELSLALTARRSSAVLVRLHWRQQPCRRRGEPRRRPGRRPGAPTRADRLAVAPAHATRQPEPGRIGPADLGQCDQRWQHAQERHGRLVHVPGQRANFSLSLRHSEYDSTDPYTENAITAAFATSF